MEEQVIDPVEHPKVRIGGKEYELKIGCGTVVRLKKEHGINLLEPSPNDPIGMRCMEIQRLLQFASEEDRAALQAELDEKSPLVSEEFKNWKPKWSSGDLVDQVGNCATIVAAAVPKMTQEKVLDELDPGDLAPFYIAVLAAVGKFAARMNQGQAAQ